MTAKRRLNVNVVSESEFFAKGHGVHTSYIESANALEKHTDIEVARNGRGRDYDIVHVHTVGLYSLFRLLNNRGKRVVSAHVVPDSFVGSLKAAKLWRPLAKLWLRFFYNRADLVIAVSDYTENELKKLGLKRPVRVVYNFIDTSKYQNSADLRLKARQKLGISSDKWVIVGSGQVQPRKRVDVFTKLAAEFPEHQFMWVGGIPFGALAADSGKMKRLIERPMENLELAGVVPLEDMADYYRAADIFILPSEQETFGLVVVEAAAAGLPVILRDIDDYKSTFADYALLALDDDDFIDKLRQLTASPEIYSKYAKRSAQLAERFGAQAAAGRLHEIYQQLLISK